MKRIFIFFISALFFLTVKGQSSITGDIGWPRQVSNNDAALIYYQPQIDKWDNYKKLTGRIAFSLTPTNGQQELGVASFTCDTKTDKDARTTYLHNIDYTDVRFPSLDQNAAAAAKKTFLALMPKGEETLSTDRLMADIDNEHKTGPTVQVKNDPPPVFYSGSPAVLLIVDGDPVLSPIEKTDLEFVVNTNWDLFYEKSSKQYFLLINDVWFTSSDLGGKWLQTTKLPKDMSALPTGQNFDDVKSMVPAKPVTSIPQIFYSNVPAELIITQGAPVYSKIKGTQLLYITNTDNDLFLNNTDSQYYVLFSGRWFRSKAFGGPWSYAGNNLPADFAKIPSDSPKGNVLSSVPGTIEASDAVMLAQIPNTVVVNRAEAEANVKVSYDGDPQFKPIEGTSMDYATNTQDKVIKVGDLYYLCFQGVWFMSTSPSGPWKTADSVPSEIYTIPASSPVYNVTYVTQTNPTSTTVECSSTSGYLGAFIIGATVGAIFDAAIVYGTGFYYPPYVYWGPGAFYPVYRPWPCTYGAGAVYNPWTGGWAAGRRVYGPYASAGSSAWYNPMTGRYGRSASVQGWYGGRTVASSYNPWTGNYGATSQGHNAYSQWGHSVVTNGSQWARTGHVTTAGGTIYGYQTSGGKEGVVTRGQNGTVVRTNNSVYAGHDGNVYKKNSSGNWNQVNAMNQTQKNVPSSQRVGGTPSENTQQSLNRYESSRQRGAQQSERFQNFNRGGSSEFKGGGFNRGGSSGNGSRRGR